MALEYFLAGKISPDAKMKRTVLGKGNKYFHITPSSMELFEIFMLTQAVSNPVVGDPEKYNDEAEEEEEEEEEEKGVEDDEENGVEDDVEVVGEARIFTTRRFPQPFMERGNLYVSSVKDDYRNDLIKKTFLCIQCQKAFSERKYVAVYIIQTISEFYLPIIVKVYCIAIIRKSMLE